MSKDSDVFEEIDLRQILANRWVQKLWYVLPLAAIFGLALWLRMLPARYDVLIGIDPDYLARMARYLVEHNLHLPEMDYMRYAPTGFDTKTELVGIYYFPAMIYLLISKIIAIDFSKFVIAFPAVFGALMVIPLFFVGKELHSKAAGLFAAFFYTVSGSVIFRTSAGFFDKESLSGFFMICGLYFFIRSIRKNSLVSGTVAAVSFTIASLVWGGIQQIYLGIVGYILIVVLLNKQQISHIKACLPVVLISVTTYGTGSSIAMMFYIALAALLLRFAVEKYSLIPKNYLPFYGPSVFLVGGVLVFIGALFSSKLAGLIFSVNAFLFYSKEIIESTVAENVDAGWGDFASQMGAPYADRMLPQILFAIPYASIWIFAFAGVFALLYKLYKEKDKFFAIGVISGFASMLTYYLFMNTKAPDMQTYFVLSFLMVILMVARKSHMHGFMLLLMYSSMLGFASKIRLAFLVGIYMSLIAGYFMSTLVRFVMKTKMMRDAKSFQEKINIYSVGVGLVVLSVLVINLASGYVLANGIGPSYSPSWKQSMDFLKTQTPEGSVILSWWDFGYYFQSLGERPSNLDGGNNFADRNRPTAQYFTGMMNESQQLYYLSKFSPDYILVDYSMIGKYSAMSKIANYDGKVDSYLMMSYSDRKDNGNVSVFIYSLGPYSLWVPITNDGRLGGNIVLSASGQDVYIKSLCTKNGEVPLNPPNDKPVFDSCLYLTPEQMVYPPMRMAYVAPREIADSPFNKLYFMDGKGLPYVEMVYSNQDQEVKIFKVNINRTSSDELREWWKTHSAYDLILKK